MFNTCMTIDYHVRRHFSVVLERTVRELRGESCIRLDDVGAPRERIMTSRSFGRPTDNLAQLRQAVRAHAGRGAEKLRGQGSVARALLVFLKTNKHRQDLPQHHPSLVVPLERPSDDSLEIVATATRALARIYRPGHQYMKAGVMLLDLIDQPREQLSLLDNEADIARRERSQQLMATLDAMNQKMGRGTVRLGVARPDAAWQLRCAHRSARYTTNWQELKRLR